MLPKYDETQLPLLAEIRHRGGRSRPRERNAQGQSVYEALAKYFGLTEKDLSEKTFEKDGTARSKWENMVRWTRNDLKKENLLLAPSHGLWAIGEKGLRYLELNRARLHTPYSNT